MGSEMAEVKPFPGVLNVFTADGVVYFMQADSRGHMRKILELQAFRIESLIERLHECLDQAESDGWINQ